MFFFFLLQVSWLCDDIIFEQKDELVAVEKRRRADNIIR